MVMWTSNKERGVDQTENNKKMCVLIVFLHPSITFILGVHVSFYLKKQIKKRDK